MRRIILVAALVVTPGCKKFNLGNLNLQDYLPKVKFEKMKVKRVDFQGMDTSFDFDIENPNPIDLKLASFDYDLALEGNGFLKGDSDEGIELKSRANSKMKLPARIDFADVFNLVGNLKGKDSVGFGLKGKFGVDTPVGPLDVPFDENGNFATIKVPKIEPKAVRVGNVNLLQNRAALEIDLAVTNNAKANAYGMQAFGYGIDLGGRRIIDGNLDDLQVAAGTTETRTIPVNLNLIEMGSSIVSAITQRQPLDVHLDAGLDVDTPLGKIPLNVDETVNLRLQ